MTSCPGMYGCPMTTQRVVMDVEDNTVIIIPSPVRLARSFKFSAIRSVEIWGNITDLTTIPP